jgi:hypothetical protein
MRLGFEEEAFIKAEQYLLQGLELFTACGSERKNDFLYI